MGGGQKGEAGGGAAGGSRGVGRERGGGVRETFSLFVTLELGAEKKKTHCGKL